MNNSFLKSRNFIFSLSIILLTLFLFLYLPIHNRSLLFPFYRNSVLEHFVNQTRIKNHIDPKLFWETREKYYPGSITVSKTGLDPNDITKELKSMGISLSDSAQAQPFLRYDSDKWHSIEFLVSERTISEVVKNYPVDANRITIQNNSEILYFTKGKKLQIIFIKPIDEMVTANGYLDVKEYDLDLIKDKYWMVISEVDADLIK